MALKSSGIFYANVKLSNTLGVTAFAVSFIALDALDDT